MGFTRWSLGLAAMALCAAPALAESLESRVARVEQQLSAQSAPSTREIQSAVDAYLASGTADASLVGGPGQAGYDGGFWIRGGTFLLKINLTLQARYEYFDWDDKEWEPSPGGDLSGFSLPRATLKFSTRCSPVSSLTMAEMHKGKGSASATSHSISAMAVSCKGSSNGSPFVSSIATFVSRTT